MQGAVGCGSPSLQGAAGSGPPSAYCLTARGSGQCLPARGSGQWASFSTLPPCKGQRAVGLLQHTASLQGAAGSASLQGAAGSGPPSAHCLDAVQVLCGSCVGAVWVGVVWVLWCCVGCVMLYFQSGAQRSRILQKSQGTQHKSHGTRHKAQGTRHGKRRRRPNGPEGQKSSTVLYISSSSGRGGSWAHFSGNHGIPVLVTPLLKETHL